MEQFLAVLLRVVFEILDEALHELLAGVPTDVALRTACVVASESKPVGPALAAAGYLLHETSGAALSVLPFPHRFARISRRLHSVSLVLNPVMIGLILIGLILIGLILIGLILSQVGLRAQNNEQRYQPN